MDDHGYECGTCGYVPTYEELHNGTCPQCELNRQIDRAREETENGD